MLMMAREPSVIHNTHSLWVSTCYFSLTKLIVASETVFCLFLKLICMYTLAYTPISYHQQVTSEFKNRCTLKCILSLSRCRLRCAHIGQDQFISRTVQQHESFNNQRPLLLLTFSLILVTSLRVKQKEGLMCCPECIYPNQSQKCIGIVCDDRETA